MHIMQSAPGPKTTIDGSEYMYFCGTGYLGLHGHPDIIQAANTATREYGLGTATSRTGYGSSPPVVQVEQRAARFWESEDSFYFASGYLGNQVVLSVLNEFADAVFLDEHAHYSVVDACRYFDLPTYTFAHRDAEALHESLKKHLGAAQVPLIMCDGVFASTGAISPVKEYIEVLSGYQDSMLCLDDCHAFGVLGAKGRGTFENVGIPQQAINYLPSEDASTGAPSLFTVGTLSKAFGGYGGILSGSRLFIEQAKTLSHYYSAASAPPIPVAAASAAALELVTNEIEIVKLAQSHARQLRQGLRSFGIDVELTDVPFVGLVLEDAENMRRIQQALADQGVLIAYAETYSGLSKEGALRISVFANHDEEDIRMLLSCLTSCL